MPFIVIDTTNDFNPLNKRQFATEVEAETAATQELQSNPRVVLSTAKVLKIFKAEVTVTAQAPEDVEPQQSADEQA
ncbi:hypothetical protein HMH05_02865 [Pseudomonas sp. SbB1]|uniref:Uncharacterized protein n=1 Tax=Pseudomonas putida (strain GB-1) TaxID=76869 RepID=B0KJQ2_PSEPG|nr:MULTISPECIES: hypothetical protein [Pseudomonas]ABY99280.1 hypothetical protein PputGB1_3389 [Pseudomonas putida GB-1]MBP0706893.1 hypothetical protein [Pseudomonas sp. T34]MCK2186331.1 hypothetical protein [Pseudomonas sp. MB04B]MDD2083562.1 hypothetical protein [Pseudomonas putida]MDD2093536.1 hypothetical protein [Pseudomonas putida]